MDMINPKTGECGRCGSMPEHRDQTCPECSPDAPAGVDSYKVVRYRFHADNETIISGVTLAQAQEWCQRDDTHGDGWFDGYTVEHA
jgi:hypothetical protein